MAALLEIEDLHTQFFTSAGTVRAVDGITYNVDEGETVAIVGESGWQIRWGHVNLEAHSLASRKGSQRSY